MDDRSEKNLKGIHPALERVVRRAYEISPIKFVVVQGVRTVEEQKKLYAYGRTDKSKGIVTNCDGVKNKSNHQVKEDGFGYAVDIYADKNANGKVDTTELSDVSSLRIISGYFKKAAQEYNVSVSWGGDWKGKLIDPPHFELKK